MVILEGVADLPLHDGHVPLWMIKYMKRMSRAILAILIDELGPEELVKRLANPFWFQALNNIIGMDWDSSGSTTVTTAIVKESLKSLESGVYVAGGKGSQAKNTPRELREYSDKGFLDPEKAVFLEKASRLMAKTGSALLQDGYTLYHHAIVFTERGSWTIIQQGMNIRDRIARRYHILGKNTLSSLEPHTGIVYKRVEPRVIDLTSRESIKSRDTIADLASEKPEEVIRPLGRILAMAKGILPLDGVHVDKSSLNEIREKILYYIPSLEEVRRVKRVLEKTWEYKPKSIDELLLIRGVGPSTIRALALVSDLIYGAPPSTRDPASRYYPFRYAYAIGGKDGIPYPYDKKTAEEVIKVLEDALERARIGEKDKLRALKRLRRLLYLEQDR